MRAAASALALLALAGCMPGSPGNPASHAGRGGRSLSTPPSGGVSQTRAASAPPTALRRWVFGRSRDGADLVAVERRNGSARHRLVVIGCVHGDEQAGEAIVAAMLREPMPIGADVILITSVNPDGHRRGTRQNAAGVDLNRNFPYHWRPIGRRGDQQYSGAAALSEPEARAVVALIRAVRPDTTVWFHQPLDLVDDSGGQQTVERAYASRVGQRFVRLTRYPGSATGWQNATFSGTTAFVDELPRVLPASRVSTFTTALWWLASRP